MTLLFFFFRGPGGPYVKSRGIGGTKMSENADFITVETYTQQEKTITTSFSYIGQHVNKIYIFGYLGGGPGGVFNYQTAPILLSSYHLTHIYVHVK